MRTSPPALLPLFRSDLQARLLAALFLDADEPLTASDLGTRTGAKPASLHRELVRLEQAGLIRHDRVGRTKRYSADRESPLHEPLHDLLERTLGVEPLLQRSLSQVDGIESAAIFGSWASGRVEEDSDIDLLVVGAMDRGDLLAEVRAVEDRLKREIDVTAYRRDEFDRRREEGSGFLRTVLRGPLTPIVGKLP
jgi:predicted nucleotidyltransferase